jgi:hypothetical protein
MAQVPGRSRSGPRPCVLRSATLLHTILLLRRGQLSTPRDRVVAKSNSTLAGSSNSAATRINHCKTTSSATPSSVSQIPHLAKVGLDLRALACYGGLLDFQVGEDLRFDRELVGKAVAFGLPAVGGHGAEVRQWHRSQGNPRAKAGGLRQALDNNRRTSGTSRCRTASCFIGRCERPLEVSPYAGLDRQPRAKRPGSSEDNTGEMQCSARRSQVRAFLPMPEGSWFPHEFAERRWRSRRRVHEPHAPTLLGECPKRAPAGGQDR